jgi:NADPH-dependent curcumin reductase CurA
MACLLGLRAGARVVATCGGAEKKAALQRLGVTRVIDYRAEDVRSVLKQEFPGGVDCVFESVGGDMLEAAVDSLAVKGRLAVIGAMSRYASGWAVPAQAMPSSLLADKLLWRSASVVGFFLPHYAGLFREHLARLCALHAAGQLSLSVDPSVFLGLDAAADAVEHLQSGRSLGKVVLRVCEPPATVAAKL